MATNYNPYLFGQVYDPDKEARMKRLSNQNLTGQTGQAESFALREQARVKQEQDALGAAKDAAAKAQQQMEAEAARQRETQQQERQSALQEAQAKLQADNFTRQMELQNRQFENQASLQQQQEAMRQAQQQYENQLVQRQQAAPQASLSGGSSRQAKQYRQPYDGVMYGSDYGDDNYLGGAIYAGGQWVPRNQWAAVNSQMSQRDMQQRRAMDYLNLMYGNSDGSDGHWNRILGDINADRNLYGYAQPGVSYGYVTGRGYVDAPQYRWDYVKQAYDAADAYGLMTPYL